MDIPSRRTRKQAKSGWTTGNLLLAFLLLPGIGFIVYVAISTGNYMGLAAFTIFLFFFIIGLNLGNIRRFLPGLAAENKEIKFPAIFIYTCLGFFALTMAGHLPKSDDFPPGETQEIATAQQDPGAGREESPIMPIADNGAVEPLDKAVAAAEKNRHLAPPPQETVEETTPVSKMDTTANNFVATKIIDAHLIQVNNQQLVRLIGIQVPDNMQQQAAAYLKEILHNQEVSLTICTQRPQDEYGRTRAVVMARGMNVNLKLIEAGYSPLIVTAPSSIDFTDWQSAENLARKQKKGIWAEQPE